MGRRTIATGIVALLVAGLFPAHALSSPARPDSAIAATENDRDLRRKHALEQLERFGAPKRLLDIFRSEEEVVSTGAGIFGFAGNDLTRNGRDEIFEHLFKWTIEYDPQAAPVTGFSQDIRTKITIRDSLRGRKLWSKSYDDYTVAVPARIGKNGRAGTYIISGLLSFFGPIEQTYLQIDAVDPRGKRLWTQGFDAVAVQGLFETVAHNVPIQIALFDGIDGAATDIILGVGEYVGTLFAFTVASRAHLIDGRDGRLTIHPTVDVGVNWLPTPDPVGDLERNGLDDYVVATNPGLDPGGPQEPPSVGGTVQARRSTDGTAIWTTGGLTMHDYELTVPLPHVVGDATRDIAIVTPIAPDAFNFRTYLLDGSTGFVRWDRLGGFPLVPGDIDRDGRRDVLLHDFVVHPTKPAIKQRAINHSGKRLWERTHTMRIRSSVCNGFCFSFTWYSLARFGRLDRDSVDETFLAIGYEEDLAGSTDRIWITDGRTGRVAHSKDLPYYPAGGALDGTGPDLVRARMTADGLGLTAITGEGGRQLWRSRHSIPQGIVKPQEAYAYAFGIDLRNDRCSDLIAGGRADEYSFYGVVDGANGRLLWAKKVGGTGKPSTVDIADSNPAC